MKPQIALGTGALLLLSGCYVDPGPGTTNASPVISAFAATTASAPTPLTTAFSWTISDPENKPLTCKLDLDNNGTYDKTVTGCTSASLRTATFTTVGVNTVKLQVSDGISTPKTATTTVTVAAANPDPFNITLNLRLVGLTPEQETDATAVFNAAAARWEGFIKTGLEDRPDGYEADYCGSGHGIISSVDDVYIDVKIAPGDGIGGADASGGSCASRSDGTTILGTMEVDSFDLPTFLTETPEAERYFLDVMTHEMGHVLGLVTGPLVDTTTEPGNPVFTGKAANGIFQELGGSGLIKVRNAGDDATGTPAHWSENAFGIEIMTPESSIPEQSPLSAMTIAALGDLGYGVDLAGAEAYSLPVLVAARAAAAAHSVMSH